MQKLNLAIAKYKLNGKVINVSEEIIDKLVDELASKNYGESVELTFQSSPSEVEKTSAQNAIRNRCVLKGFFCQNKMLDDSLTLRSVKIDSPVKKNKSKLLEITPIEEELPKNGARSSTAQNDADMLQQHNDGLHISGSKNNCLKCFPKVSEKIDANHSKHKEKNLLCSICNPAIIKRYADRIIRVRKICSLI